MRSRVAASLFLSFLLLPATGCGTIAGTVVSPITGGVDLVVQTTPKSQWYWMPFVFVGGAVSGPFVAFYNGLNYDPSVFRDFGEYWDEFDQVFRPFDMIGL